MDSTGDHVFPTFSQLAGVDCPLDETSNVRLLDDRRCLNHVQLRLPVKCFGLPKRPVLLDRFVYEIRGINGFCDSLSLLTNLCMKSGF
jgi:hypothetical protein